MTQSDPNHEALLAEFDGSVCPACHHRAHDPGGCSECPRCELHTDEATAFVLRYEPELLRDRNIEAAIDDIIEAHNVEHGESCDCPIGLNIEEYERIGASHDPE